MNDDELAFFDAVAQNESAVHIQGEGVLAQIARDLVAVMRRSEPVSSLSHRLDPLRPPPSDPEAVDCGEGPS